MSSSDDGDSTSAKALKDAKEEAELKARALHSARAKREEVSTFMVGMMMEVPLDILHVSQMFNAGGLRQRNLSEDSTSVTCIRQSGFDPAIASMCAIEVGFTTEEWKEVSSSSSSSQLALNLVVCAFELHQRVHTPHTRHAHPRTGL